MENSGFFQAACHNEWKEATSRVIKLPGVDPDAFNLYLFWVHRGKLAFRNDWDPDGEDCEENALAVQDSLVKLWVLADRLADVRLCNTIIDEMGTAIEMCQYMGGFTLFPPALTSFIWSATTAGRSIRQLITDYYITYVYAGDVEQNMDEHHPDFLKGLMLAALFIMDEYGATGPSPENRVARNGCHYHDHAEKSSEQDCLPDEGKD